MNKEAHMKQGMDIGSGGGREKVAQGLAKLLANSYMLYIKTHGFHWNVTGPLFVAVHDLTERQYTDLALGVDEIAERIRALGVFAPGSGGQFAELATIREETGVPSTRDMLEQLIAGQEEVIRTAREAAQLAEEAGDQATADLAAARMAVHEKNAWMLGSLLEA